MKTIPRISIIMPVYNGERYVEQAVRSLLDQTVTDIEVIAIDDGSLDRSLVILERMSQADKRLVVRSRPNSGSPSAPKNDGLAIARGEYIGFLDCDDYSDPDHLHRLIDGLDSNPAWVAAFHDLDYIDPAGQVIPGTYLGKLRFLEKASIHLSAIGGDWFDCGPDFYKFVMLNFGAMHTQSVLIARERLKGADITYDTSFKIVDDTDLWMRLAGLGRIGYLNKVLGHYRIHESNITRRKLVLARDHLKLHLKHYEAAKAAFDSRTLGTYRDRIAISHSDLAYLLYREGANQEARDHFDKSQALRPRLDNRLGKLKTYVPRPLVQWLRKARAA